MGLTVDNDGQQKLAMATGSKEQNPPLRKKSNHGKLASKPSSPFLDSSPAPYPQILLSSLIVTNYI